MQVLRLGRHGDLAQDDNSLLGLDFSGLVVDEGDGPLFAGLIVGDGAGARVGAVDMSLPLTDRHTGLQFIHSRNDLMGVDGCPDVLGPVVVDGMRIVVIEEHIAEILFLTAVHCADDNGVKVRALRKREDGKGLPGAMGDSVVNLIGRHGLDGLLDVEPLGRWDFSPFFGEFDMTGFVREIGHGVAVLHPDVGVLELKDVVERSGELHAHDGDIVGCEVLVGCGLGKDAGIAAVLEDRKEIDAANGDGDERHESGFLPGLHLGLGLLRCAWRRLG